MSLLRRGLAPAAVVLLAVALPAAGRTAFDVEEVRALLARGRFTPQQTEAVLSLLARADRGGLPVAALSDRIREGVARRAAPQAVLGVVEDRLAQLQRADEVVRGCARQGVAVRGRERSLVRLADSFGLGVRPGDVLDMAAGASRAGVDIDTVARGAEVLGRLERKGFPSDETREVVAAAVAAAWPAERMEEIVGFFLEADVLHLSPQETRQLLVEGIREKKAGESLVAGIRKAVDEGRGGKRESRGLDKGSGSSAGKREGARATGERRQRPD